MYVCMNVLQVGIDNSNGMLAIVVRSLNGIRYRRETTDRYL